MVTGNQTEVIKDLQNKKMTVTRHFDATVEHVWRAWTESDLLDQWWAPKPYHVETKTMNFKPGGYWLYAMVGPEPSKTWCKFDYGTIHPNKSFEGADMFCDEDGKKNPEFASMKWKVAFHPVTTGTKVIVEISFDKEEDMQKILEMGLEQGFTMALNNLEEVLAK